MWHEQLVTDEAWSCQTQLSRHQTSARVDTVYHEFVFIRGISISTVLMDEEFLGNEQGKDLLTHVVQDGLKKTKKKEA